MSLKSGDPVRVVRGKGSPLASEHFGIFAAVLTGDCEVIGMLDCIDAEQRRKFAWGFNDKHVFKIQGETITLKEFIRRFESLEWCKENNEHVISYLRMMWENTKNLREHFRTTKPHLFIQQRVDTGDEVNTKTALIRQEATPEQKAAIMEKFNEM